MGGIRKGEGRWTYGYSPHAGDYAKGQGPLPQGHCSVSYASLERWGKPTRVGEDDDAAREYTRSPNLHTSARVPPVRNLGETALTPEMARPTIKVVEFCATAQIRLPTSKMKTAPRKAVLMSNRL